MPTEKERMLNGESYDPTDPELVAERRRARELTRRFDRSSANPFEGIDRPDSADRMHPSSNLNVLIRGNRWADRQESI